MRLRLRNLGETNEEPPEECLQACKRELGLGLDRRVLHHLEPVRLLHGVVEQHRFADPRAAAEYEDTASAETRLL
jgi:hypothetical protein